MARVLANQPNISNGVEIAIEYKLPLSSRRVDFMIGGSDYKNKDNVVIIELKQWQEVDKVDDTKYSVETYVGGGIRTLPHPSYQAYSYQRTIENYSQYVQEHKITLSSCAFLHNMSNLYRSILADKQYSSFLKKSPFFLGEDRQKLREFIFSKVNKSSSNGNLISQIEYGRIRPSKSLQDCLGSMLKGNEEFKLLDEQATVYDSCLVALKKSAKDHKKRVIIIKGGPGTGKSVLAINLLYEALRNPVFGHQCTYITKNAAPRESYKEILSKGKALKRAEIEDLFKSSANLAQLADDHYDCLIVDEAHRLVKRSVYDKYGQNQVRECIEKAKVCIFFIDETQKVTTKDIGTIEEIISQARFCGVEEKNILRGENYVLSCQFRCNGSDAYITFINDLLGLKAHKLQPFDFEGFDFRVYDDVVKMRDDLRKKNEINNKARMVAGYCWPWNTNPKKKNKHPNQEDCDIDLQNHEFKAKWNLANSSSTWAIKPHSFEEVGCIHSSQGMEFDYIGVIIGPDLFYRDGKVLTDKTKIDKDDNSSGIRGCKDLALADELIRNTYKVLLTRGQKGCYVYCEDKALSNYIKEKIGQKN